MEYPWILFSLKVTILDRLDIFNLAGYAIKAGSGIA